MPRLLHLLTAAIVSLTSAFSASLINVAHTPQAGLHPDQSLVTHESHQPWITSRGPRFVDSRTNKPVLLHGVNVMLGTPPTYEGVAAMHVNLVRLVISWSRIEPSPPVDGIHRWNTTDLVKLDAEVAWFEKHGINVVLDFHQAWWSSFFHDSGNGIPAWYYAGGPFDPTQASEAQAAFWTTDSSRSISAYSAFAAMIANRYGTYPNVIGYEILNEPPSGSLGDNATSANMILQWEAAVGAAIRSVDPDRTIFLSCCALGDNQVLWSNYDSFGDLKHLALDFHDYWPGPNIPVYSKTLADQLGHLQPVLAKTTAAGIPLLIGEWGIPNTTSNGSGYQSQMLALFAQDDLSNARWFFWPHDAGKYTLINPTDGSFTPLGLQLARTWATG